MDTVLTTTTIEPIKELSTHRIYRFQLIRNGEPYDLAKAESVSVVFGDNNYNFLHSKEVTITNPQSGEIEFRLLDSDWKNLKGGNILIEFVVIDESNQRWIFPSNGYVKATIHYSLRNPRWNKK